MIRLDAGYAALLAGMHERCFPTPWTEKDMAGLLALPGVFGFLVEQDGPLGAVLARAAGGESEILTVMVLDSCRRQGWGQALLSAAFEAARQAGAHEMFLEVAVENEQARGLYDRLGFRPVGLRRRYYGDKDALVLRKDLDD
ncbi:MAG: GNAT family N-acetyltransferase [Rhodospirillaceae bacterium]|nr:GNAT family N-acetyltransferase [Rhodospirillaceae bacterium]